MFSFFESIAGIFSTIVDYIVNSVSILVALFLMISRFFMGFAQLFIVLPEFLLWPAAVVLSLVIIYHVLNRS